MSSISSYVILALTIGLVIVSATLVQRGAESYAAPKKTKDEKLRDAKIAFCAQPKFDPSKDLGTSCSLHSKDKKLGGFENVCHVVDEKCFPRNLF